MADQLTPPDSPNLSGWKRTSGEEQAKKIVSEVRDFHAASWKSKEAIMQRMKLDLIQYLGRQFSGIDQVSGQVFSATDDQVIQTRNKGYKLAQKNKMKPAVGVYVSQLTQRMPQLYAVPTTRDERVKNSAKKLGHFFTFFQQRRNYAGKDKEVALWTVICGTALKWVHPVRRNGKVEVDLMVVNPFDFCPTPGVREINRMRAVAVEQWSDRKALEETTGLTLEEGQAVESYSINPEDNLMISDQRKDQKRMIDYFRLPRPGNEGFHYIVCDDKLLHEGTFPYWTTDAEGRRIYDGYRMSVYRYNDTLVSFWATGMCREVYDAQRNLNRFLSAWLTNRELTLGLKLGKKKGCKLDKNFFSNRPSSFEVGPGGEMPVWLIPPVLPADIGASMEKLERNFDEESGIHDLTKGDEPARRMPALGMQFITELDLGKHRHIFDAWEDSNRDTGFDLANSLRQFGRNWAFAILGKGQEYQVEDFLTDDLSDMEIRVERGSSMPLTQAGQTETAIELLHYKGFNMDKRSHRLGLLEALGKTHWTQGMIEEELASREFAREENRRLIRGEAVLVNDYQDHDGHIEEHCRPLDGPEYFEIAGKDSEQRLLKHIAEHRQRRAMMLMSIKAENELIQGPPPETPAPAGQPAPPEGMMPALPSPEMAPPEPPPPEMMPPEELPAGISPELLELIMQEGGV